MKPKIDPTIDAKDTYLVKAIKTIPTDMTTIPDSGERYKSAPNPVATPLPPENFAKTGQPVSYTHQTLPTKRIV